MTREKPHPYPKRVRFHGCGYRYAKIYPGVTCVMPYLQLIKQTAPEASRLLVVLAASLMVMMEQVTGREDLVIVMKMGRAATQRKKVPAPVQWGQRERRPEAAERGSKGKYRFIQPFPSRKNDEIFHLQTIKNYIFYSTFL